MQKFIMLAGPSGSGKSTYAHELSNDLQFIKTGRTIVSSDRIRKTLYGDESIQIDHHRVFDVAHTRIGNLLDEGASVIFDATNLVPKFRVQPLMVARTRDIKCELHYMMTDGITCVERVAVRERTVPSHVIARQIGQWERDLERGLHEFYEEGFAVVKFVK